MGGVVSRRKTFLGIALSIAFFAQGCDGIGDLVSPGPTNRSLRILQRPFDGRFQNHWPFDHDLPLGALSRTGDEMSSEHVLTWRGETVEMSWGDGRQHDGYDWGMPEGTPLKAAADGEVIAAGRGTRVACGAKGDGAAVSGGIRRPLGSGQGYETEYLHLSRVDVEVGASVDAGQQIGLAGQTGCASGPHLHFRVFRYTSAGPRVVVDPFGWEGAFPDPWAVHTGVESLWLWKRGEAPAGDYSF